MSSLRINDFARSVHELAKAKGWYDGEPRTPLEIHMLIVSEIAEATECVRNGEAPIHQGRIVDGHSRKTVGWVTPEDHAWGCVPGIKPEGEAVELADAVIRVMDYFVARGWDLEATLKLKHAYNATRPHRHGGKLK